jgi:hypothetical protein
LIHFRSQPVTSPQRQANVSLGYLLKRLYQKPGRDLRGICIV